MSTRTFCDSCGDEINDRNRVGISAMSSTTGAVQFDIVNIGWNDHNKGDVCRYCVYDAIYQKDDRTREIEVREVEATNA